MREQRTNLTKFDRFNDVSFNKLLAYLSIINSLNYKWYKSSKRRFLLPNFYFTRSFYNFYLLYFFRNIFRKKIQPFRSINLFSFNFFFEKKMFLKSVHVNDFFKSKNAYNLFFNNKYMGVLHKHRFFFKNEFLSNSYGFFLASNNLDDVELSKFGIFKKPDITCVNSFVDFNFLIFAQLFNCSLVEFYKINTLLLLNNIVK